jgi:hypothetical protein
MPHRELAHVSIQSMHGGSCSAATTMSPPWRTDWTGGAVVDVVVA